LRRFARKSIDSNVLRNKSPINIEAKKLKILRGLFNNLKKKQKMKIILVSLILITMSNCMAAQNQEQLRMGYMLLNRDSISQIYMKFVFNVKNSEGETLEMYAKRKLGDKYDIYLPPQKWDIPDTEQLQAFMRSSKFKSIIKEVNKTFFKDRKYRTNFIRTWNNTHLILDEIVCSHKEYMELIEKTLMTNRLYFTLTILPQILNAFNIELDL
jgi:hypothetical protein